MSIADVTLGIIELVLRMIKIAILIGDFNLTQIKDSEEARQVNPTRWRIFVC